MRCVGVTDSVTTSNHTHRTVRLTVRPLHLTQATFTVRIYRHHENLHSDCSLSSSNDVSSKEDAARRPATLLPMCRETSGLPIVHYYELAVGSSLQI